MSRRALQRLGVREGAWRAHVAALGLVLAACGKQPGRSVLLVTLDSTRPDALGAYGHAPSATPNLDWVAEEGIVFERAFTSAPLTLPAHASILTGLYPPRHGVRDDGIAALPQSAATLAELAREAGHATAAFLGTTTLDAGFGLDQGFETYEPPARRFYSTTGKPSERSAKDVCSMAEQWLAQQDAERPFFLWVHLADARPPHEAEEKLLSRAEGDPYQAEIVACDLALGRLFAALRRREQLESTLILVAGDHGLARGEHGEVGSGSYIWNSTVRVPLIARRPFGKHGGQRQKQAVSVVDLFPTALGGMGVAIPAGIDGVDLLGDERRTRGVYFESIHGALSFDWQPWTGWADERGTSMHAARPLFFALDDVGEEHDLATERAADVAVHRAGLADVARAQALSPDAEGVDPELRGALEAVGYGQASFEEQMVATPPVEEHRGDPLQRVAEESALGEAAALVEAETWGDAEARLTQLLETHPANRTARELLGVVCLRTDRAAQAAALFERALEGAPGRGETWMRLGKARLVTGDEEGALRAFLRALELDPHEVQALGGLLHMMDGAGLEARAAPLRARFESIQARP